MLRRTPLYETHVAAGARMVPFAGFEMPVQYVGVSAEHKTVRSAVGLFDVSHMGEVRFRGPGATEALSWLVSHRVDDLPVGQARYAMMCNESGGVVDDVFLYRMADDDILVCVNAANREKDFAWMTSHLPASVAARVEVVDEGDDWAQIAVQGPLAEATLQPLTTLSLSEMGARHHAIATVAGVPGCIVARTGYTGEDGFEVFIPVVGAPEHAMRVWSGLLASGAPHGVQPIGLGARDTLRLEVRNALYGHELDDDTSPFAARMMWVVKLDKAGGFLGAEAIRARQATDTHFLVGCLIDDRKIVREGMQVLHEGQVVGRTTSGTLAPMLDQGVAMAYVPRALSEPGTRLSFDVRGRIATGTVVKGAFYAPQSKKKG
jgi:aminomethyltransferase